MSETDLQIGGGYTYQWECAILLALNYFFEPVRYNPTLFDLVEDFLGQVAEIHLEGKDRESDVELEDVALVGGDRRILIQVKTKQAEGERWTPSDDLLLKALWRFYDSPFLDDRPDDTRFVFLTNRPFNPDLVRVKSAVEEGTVAECAEADKLCQHLDRYARKEKKGKSIAKDRFHEMLARTRLVEYLAVDVVKANVQRCLRAYGRSDWEQAHAVLFEDFARRSTRIGGGTVTRASVVEVLGPPPEAVTPPPPPPIPFQVPRRAPHFQDREQELAALLDHLRPGAAVTLCGPGGIGKTALAAEALAQLPEDRFPDGIIFHTFYRQPEAALALEHVARSYGHDPRPTPADAARMALAGKRALLVLDGTEEADDLGAVLACAGKCGVLVTSRRRGDAPDPSLRFDLGPLEEPQAVALLRAWGGARAGDREAAEAICRMVGRLPLAVQLAGAYLASHDEEAADYLAWLETTPLAALDFDQKQHRSVPVLMERSVERVSEAAQSALGLVGLMGFASFGREAIAAGLGVEEGEAGRALGELVDYGLLARQDGRYAVSHALVHTYARKRVSPGEEAGERLAAHYLALAQETGDHAVLNAERPHLLAALSDAHRREDWEITLGFTWALNDWLDLQGHWTDRVAVLEQALDAARGVDDRSWEGAVLGNLGITYHDLGQVEQAVEYFQEALAIFRETGDRQGEGSELGNLGIAYADLGQVEQAIEYHQEALEIAREIGDRQGEGSELGNLGSAYRDLGQVEQAVEYHRQALAISREIGDRRNEGNWLGNLGIAYADLGQVEQAVEYFQKALEIAHEIGDRRGEGGRLGNLGLAYRDLGQVERAVEFYNQALEIAREIGDRREEGADLGNLGLAYRDLGQVERAVEFYNQALEIAREIGDRRGEGNRLGNLGIAYRDLGDTARARRYLSQALAIFEEIKSPYAERARHLLEELD